MCRAAIAAGHCNVYYRSVNWQTHAVTFHSNHGIRFLSEKPEAALRPWLMHFEQHVGLRNQKYYTPMGGVEKMDVVPFYRNWRENETTYGS